MNDLKKYFQVVAISWQNGFVYRVSLYLWRIRQFIGSLAALTIWSVIMANNGQFGSYSQAEMITYIFIVAVLQNIVLSSVLNGLARDVYSGKITTTLVKPLNIFTYFAMLDIADKLKNTLFIIGESMLLFVLFKPEIIFPTILTSLAVLLLVFLAIVLNFAIALLFGAIGFWSPDSWAPRFLFFLLVDLTAGRTFPLDILPLQLQKILMLTPFPYLSFIQTQLFLGRISLDTFWLHLLTICAWILVLGFLAKKIWQRGLRDYAAVGQ